MIRLSAIVLCLALAVAPAFAQTPAAPKPWTDQIDPAAIMSFDPDGAAGIPLRADLVRSYLGKPIAAPTPAEKATLRARRHEAEAAKKEILSGEDLYAPLWTENAFELKDGSIRPMTVREKAVFSELDAIDAAETSERAQYFLSLANEIERTRLADALTHMLEAGVRLAGRDTDGYRKVDTDWIWVDLEDGVIVASRPASLQAENALLRYEVAQAQLSRGIGVRIPDVLARVHYAAQRQWEKTSSSSSLRSACLPAASGRGIAGGRTCSPSSCRRR
jgi:hypothetical protein